MKRCLVLAVLCLAWGCTKSGPGSSASSNPSTPSPATPAPAPTTFTISGSLTATNDGRPLAGATVTIANSGVADGARSVTSDGGGGYSVTLPPVNGLVPYTVQGPNLVPRQGFITAGASRSVNLDAIVMDSSFDLNFFRMLVRGTLDGPAHGLVRWTTNPNIYIRTVDTTSGRAVEPEVLALVTDWSQRSVPAWSANKFRVNTLETGSAERPLTDGWINVDFVRQPSAGFCGQALVGANPGHVVFNDDRCNCGSVKVPAGTVLHEFGHAMGFGHVSDTASIMYPQDPGGCPNPNLSVNEQRHSAIAYKRPLFNLDPDTDQANAPLVAPAPRMIQ